MTILEYVEEQITAEAKRLQDNELPLDTRVITYQDRANGFKEKIIGDKTQYGKLLDVKYDILNNPLYKHSKFNHYSFKTFKTKDKGGKDIPYLITMSDKAQAFANNPKGTFIISGQTGLGKSHLCTSIVKHLMMKGYTTDYVVWQEELDRIKSIDFELRNREYEHLGNVEVLYLDDFLKTSSNDGKISESDMRNTNNIINRRYTRNLITIISTELNYNDIAEIHGSLAGRLLEMSDTKNGNYFLMIANKPERNYRLNFQPKII